MHGLAEAGIGFAAALLTSIPMLGPVVLLLFSAGIEPERSGGLDPNRGGVGHSPTPIERRAANAVRALAIGAALAEGVHVALVVYGLGPMLLARVEVALWLRLVAGLVLIALAVMAWRARAGARSFGVRTPLQAATLGVTLVLINPGFLVTWIAVVASLSQALTVAQWGMPFVVGAVLGVLAWFSTVHWLAKKVGPRLEKHLGILRAVVAVLLAGLGVWLVVAALI